MLRGALVTALVASSLARGGDAIGADDRSRAGGSRPNADAVVVEPLDLINVLRDVSEEGSGVAFGAASRRPLARSSAPDRDDGSCDIHAPSRFADPAARAPLWGGGASQPTHPSVVRFMNAQGWRDPQLVVPRPGDGAPTPSDDEDWIAHAHDMLATTQFFVTTPTLADRVADDLREYVFRLASRHDEYRSDVGCVGNLANCKERFDMPLRLSPTVVAAMNQYVRTMKPVIERELGPNAELCELSALMTCSGSPDQSVHADGQGLGKDDRLLSSFTVLQDTTSAHGPTEVFFPAELTLAHALSAGQALVKAANGEYGARFEKVATASPAMRRLAKRLRVKFGVTKNGETEDVLRPVDMREDPVETLRDTLVREHVYRSKKTNMLYFRVPWEPEIESSDGKLDVARSKLRGGAPYSKGSKGRRYNIGITASLRQGSTLVYDSRALHRGSANRAGSRILFLMSFQNPGAAVDGPTYTMDPRYQRTETWTADGASNVDTDADGYDDVSRSDGSDGPDPDDDWNAEDDDPDEPEGIDGDLAELRAEYGAEGNEVAVAELARRRSEAVTAARKMARRTSAFTRTRGLITLADFPIEPDVDDDDFSWIKSSRADVASAQETKQESEIAEKVRRAGMDWGEYGRWRERVHAALKAGHVDAALNAWPGTKGTNKGANKGTDKGTKGNTKGTKGSREGGARWTERWDDDLGFVPTTANDHRQPLLDTDDGPGSYRHQHAQYASKLVDA